MILSATGHRPDKLGGYDKDTTRRIRRAAHRALLKLRPDKVVSGMALGWDQAIAVAALNLGIPFTAAIPFKGQEARWPYDSQREYLDLLDKAARIVCVCDGRYATWKMQKRNEWMVENSDHIAALWNGTSGGTANCVRYAQALRKPITNFWTDFNG